METKRRPYRTLPPGMMIGRSTPNRPFKASADNTGGALFVTEASVPPQAGPPPHVRSEDEAIYVLDGEIEMLEG